MNFNLPTLAPLPNDEREDIARTVSKAARAMKLASSPRYNPRDPEWAKLGEGLTAENAGDFGRNYLDRHAKLMALDEKALTTVLKKAAKAPVNPMNNLFVLFEESESPVAAVLPEVAPVASTTVTAVDVVMAETGAIEIIEQPVAAPHLLASVG